MCLKCFDTDNNIEVNPIGVYNSYIEKAEEGETFGLSEAREILNLVTDTAFRLSLEAENGVPGAQRKHDELVHEILKTPKVADVVEHIMTRRAKSMTNIDRKIVNRQPMSKTEKKFYNRMMSVFGVETDASSE